MLNYDFNKYKIKFPFIKYVNNKVHIIYYEINKDKYNFIKLVHYYKKDNVWIRNDIDFLNYTLINNFEVVINNDNIKIYYFKLVDKYEELFVCNYSFIKEKWDLPIQITFSKTQKIYLSVLKSLKENYHIVYCEKNTNQFYCKYLKINFENNIPYIKNDIFLSYKITSVFPNILEYKNNLYCQYLEYNNLYYTYSLDDGENWSNVKLFNNLNNNNFTQFIFKSNCSKDNINASKFYSYTNSINILGSEINN